MENKKTLERRRQALYHKWEKKVGLPFSEEFRKGFEPFDDPDDNEVLQDIESNLQAFFGKLHDLSYFPEQPKKERNNRPRKRYQRLRSLEKPMELIRFVIGDQLTLGDLFGRHFLQRKRIKWKQTCEAWREAHPGDPIKPAVLKASFYRYIADPDIKEAYFDSEFRRLLEGIRSIGAIKAQFKIPSHDWFKRVQSVADKLEGVSASEREELFMGTDWLRLLSEDAEDAKKVAHEAGRKAGLEAGRKAGLEAGRKAGRRTGLANLDKRLREAQNERKHKAKKQE